MQQDTERTTYTAEYFDDVVDNMVVFGLDV
jgi:hypothetical protein